MVKFINKETKILVQGITGTQGRFHTRLMLEYGTNILAGVTPGRGGQKVEGIPVYDTVIEAIKSHQIDASIIFVPAPFALDAALESIESGLNPIVIITEGMPVKDSVHLLAKARLEDLTIIGPNTPGVINVRESKLGIMPSHIFKEGSVGIVSRSGTLFYEIAADITSVGLGESNCIGLGGDPVVGLDFIKPIRWLEDDPKTRAIVIIGEIGGDAEERVAEIITKEGISKPIVAYVAGRTAVPGKRMGHAGAIIQGSRGTAESKMNALREAGIIVREQPGEVAYLLKKLIN